MGPAALSPVAVWQEEIEALKRQLAASLGADGSSGIGGIDRQHASAAPSSGGPTVDGVPPPIGPDEHSAGRPPGKPRPPSSPPATDSSVVAMEHGVNDRPVKDNARGNPADSARDDPVDGAAIADAAGALPGEEGTEREAHSTGSIEGGSLAVQELAATGAEGGGERTGEVEILDERRSGKEGTENGRRRSAQSPDVVVQETIVERVVVEEKVRTHKTSSP